MNLYNILNVNYNASDKEIKKAYYKLAKKYHPDKNKETIDKFNNILFAYNILSNEESRKQYNEVNNLNKGKFEDLLFKIFKNNLKIDELQSFGINLSKKDYEYLDSNYENYLNNFSFIDIFNLFNKNFLSKKEDPQNLSESDCNEWTEEMAEYYDELPISLLKFNSKDIKYDRIITYDMLNSNKVINLKIKRKINEEFKTTNLKFNINKKYVVFVGGGDYYDDSFGNLIIELKLPQPYNWGNGIIYYNYSINIYELIFGLNINIKEHNYNVFWIPIRDGLFVVFDKLIVKLNLVYKDSDKFQSIIKELSVCN